MTDERLRVWWTRAAGSALVAGLAGIAVLAAEPRTSPPAGAPSDEVPGHTEVGPVSRDFQSRLDSLRLHVNAVPDDASARLALAHLLHDAHRLPEAMEQYEAALALEPSRAARFDLAQARTQSGDADGALALMEAALRDDPGDVAALYNLGAIEATRGNREAAISFWRRVVETGHPEYAPRARRSIGQLEDARTRS